MRQKADVIISGNLTAQAIGGGNLYACKEEQLEECFDCADAVRIQGDVCVDSFDACHRTVVVLGYVAQRGGQHG